LIVEMLDRSTINQDVPTDPPDPPAPKFPVPELSAPEPFEDSALTEMKLFVHDRLIVKWFAKQCVNNIEWHPDLTDLSILQSIDELHQELKGIHHQRVADLLNSKPLPVEAEKYEVLREFNIPLNEEKIKALIRDLQCLNNDLPSGHVDLFTIPSWNDSSRNMLSIPKASSQERFERHARVDNFIPRLPSAMIPPIPVDNQQEIQDGEIQEGEKHVDLDDAAMWLLKMIGLNHTEAPFI
jgi:hypothetical protein